jgi:hypothetical protein
MNPQKSLSLLLLANALLTPVIALKYSYNAVTTLESAGAFLLLLGAAAILGLPWRQPARRPGGAIGFGLLVGLLWAVEIGINNFLAPPLPGRDIIDNLFWAAIAVLILFGSLAAAYRARRFRAGAAFGWWSGIASGAVACSMALAVIVFGMKYLLQDPLNLAEWAARLPEETAPSMAAYFAYQTLAGGLMHLVVLGAGMGLLLGALGGGIGKVILYFFSEACLWLTIKS